jgi:hypothetical protein
LNYLIIVVNFKFELMGMYVTTHPLLQALRAAALRAKKGDCIFFLAVSAIECNWAKH